MGYKDTVITDLIEQLTPLVIELSRTQHLSPKAYAKIVKKFPQQGGKLFSKDQIIAAYRYLQTHQSSLQLPDDFVPRIQMKPIRTGSGVTPVTVLTKPFPCPGKCIFCPNDIRMPKSYLRNEPGAQRAERNQFDPYLQVYSRLLAFKNIGHLTDKVEIIVLGGTWSFYPESYQIWFIKRCFDALNDFGIGVDRRDEVEQMYQSKHQKKYEDATRTAGQHAVDLDLATHAIHGQSLKKTYNQVISELYTAPEKLLRLDADQHASWEELYEAHRTNEHSSCRNVGLVIETRPDNISEGEVIRIRKLGCTKTQIGFQSLQDDVLTKNKRGHDVAATRRAVRLLRLAGFKIHAHWMPNLYGSSPERDIDDFHTLFSDDDFKPDELKIYPCSLIESAELMQYYQQGLWHPYTHDELLTVLTSCIQRTPEYCRLTRVIRDIPSTDIVAGNKLTNFREVAEKELQESGILSRDIRAREIQRGTVDPDALLLDEVHYTTSVSDEVFLQFVTPTMADSPELSHRIAGFLRLSLPKVDNYLDELALSAMIREIHVYGQTTSLGARPGQQADGLDRAQHVGLGKKLIARAEEIARARGYKKLQVISAIGTREYYRNRGFVDGELYQYKEL